METIVSFTSTASYDDAMAVVVDLMNFVEQQSSSAVSLYCTGTYPLFHQMSVVTSSSFETIDATGN